jgi:uncharacterized integral membrane protein
MTDQSQVSKPKSSSRDVAALVLGVIAIAIALANREKVKVDWIVGTWHMPLIILIALCLLIGIVVGYFAALRRGRRKDD